ncbi:hypothetical protein [Pyxidicoccus sp. MSG2]|uniref:hypothetical protein n=1 Tax=Pyxidicoccus sp. MSG2 TaxID=2996790 RepID=UPI0022708D5B|nr:hypothetical protein [Pyxidicoccus sp. MSG2]MCY1021096.1 hypothetical protein [Pyxidicoccus sp. MSG2]
MQSRLNALCAGIDRTADMGPFPHDQSASPLFEQDADELLSSAGHAKNDATTRDQSMWELIYRQTPKQRSEKLPDLLYTVATEAKEAVLRRSASWGLLKLGETKLLQQSLRGDDDGNVHSWKQHLIYESQGRTDWVDPRPVRSIKSEFGYAVTLPLTIHGTVVFREYKYGPRGEEPLPPPYMAAKTTPLGTRSGTSAYTPAASPYGGGSAEPSYSARGASPTAFNWYSFAAGPIAQRALVGDLTAAVGQNSFYDNLVIQKVAANTLGDGSDHVQGYLFQGMSRSMGGNAMAHYYSSRGPQPLYLSGRIGDASEGVVNVETQLLRHAETHIVTNPNVAYPYVQSVRGLFFGPARMNTIIARDRKVPLDNLLQIVKEPYANGWFFGEFRSVAVDVDGDDQIEINGMEMYTDLSGAVVNRTPPGPQKSSAFAR